MVRILPLILFCFAGVAYAQIPLPAIEKTPVQLSPEQNGLNFIRDSLWRPELFADACKGDLFKPGKRFLVYDSTYHLPEPIMVYQLANPNLSHEELISLTERQIIQFSEKQKLDFNLFESPGVHFTTNPKDFKIGYYFVRVSQPMSYEGYLYFDFWIKETPVLPGINILIRTDAKGRVDQWQSYTICQLREK